MDNATQLILCLNGKESKQRFGVDGLLNIIQIYQG